MDATETVILLSIFLLAAALIALPRVLARRSSRPVPEDPGEHAT